MVKMSEGEEEITNKQKDIPVCDKTRAQLLPILQLIQDRQGYISDNDMQQVADKLRIHPVEVYSVVTFYSFLYTKKKGRHVIYISSCISNEMAGSGEIMKEFEKELNITCGETTEDGNFTLERTSCIGMCEYAPAILVDGKLIGNVTLNRVKEIIKNVQIPANKTGGDNKKQKKQGPVIFSEIEPYAGLKKALQMGKHGLLKTLKDSNLKGRGGAGFPTGLKWDFTASEHAKEKYVICNADEGEPGTFKDRVLLTGYACLLFEGMVIGGFAIGAKQGYVYLRGEYKFLLPDLNKQLQQMRKDNALGKSVMGQEGFDFDIEIRLGSGAYVCGEETALIESLEGCRGEPRNRPPYPVNTGYNCRPTIVNNVETFSAVTHIIAKGADWFKSFGTQKSAGSKLLSISGDCGKPGVYEVPFGISVKQILEMVEAENTQAVQIGGASGICVPQSRFERKIAFEDIPTGGSVIIFNKNRKMLDIAENFLKFFEEESCGQCTPCREGVPVLLEGLKKIKNGQCSKNYASDLFSLCETMRLASKCGLGQTASVAFESILENFKGEYKLVN